MTTKERLIGNLIDCGMFQSQAEQIIELAIPVLNKQAHEINGFHGVTFEPKNPYQINWDAPSFHYPDGLYAVWFMSIKPIALKWIDENKPQAWFRDMFVDKHPVKEEESLDERILEDNFPVYCDYLYVCDGKVIKSDIQGTVKDLRRDLRSHFKLEAKVITTCDIEGRKKRMEQSEQKA